MTRAYTDEEARQKVLAIFPKTIFHEPYPGANKSWSATCESGHDFRQSLNEMTKDREYQCRKCRPSQERSDEDARNIILDKYPKTVFHEPYPGARENWHITCENGHDASVSFMGMMAKTRKYQCRKCSPWYPWTDEEAREFISEIYPGTVFLETYPGAKSPWSLLCPKGHPRSPSFSNLKKGTTTICKECNLDEQAYSDEEARTIILSRFPGTTFREPYPKRIIRDWKMTCPRGHDVVSTLNQIVNEGWGFCQKCVGINNRLSDEQARNKVLTLHPNLTISEPYPGGTGKEWNMMCEKGHPIRTTYACASNPNTISVCSHRSCRTMSYDENAPAVIYRFIFYEGSECLVFGKSGKIKDRMRAYSRKLYGIHSLETRYAPVGRIITDIETELKRAMKRHGIDSCYKDIGVSGLTESFWLDETCSPEFMEEFDRIFYKTPILGG